MPEITAAMLQSDGPALSLGKRGRTPFGGGGGSADPDAPFQPPEETPLMDLPSGIPETIPIVCNGRKAFFTVRTQYVEYQVRHGRQVGRPGGRVSFGAGEP